MAERVTTKDALKKLDKQLECSICLDTFKQPKLLPCFHVFCKSPCLERLVAKNGHSLTCPICRHIVPLSENGVSGLQSDFHIDRLFEIRDTFNKAAESTQTQCGSCEDGKATGYCRDCGDLLCDECQAAHKRTKPTRNHKLLTLNELVTQATCLAPPKKDFPHCKKHVNKKLKIYCETCKEVICNDCTIHYHKGHNYRLLVDIFLKHKKELVSNLKPVKQKLHTVQQALKAFDTRAKEINDQRDTLQAHIHSEIKQLHQLLAQLLDQRSAQLLNELDMLTQHKLKSLEAQRYQVEITRVKLNSCLEYAEGGLQTGTEDQILAMKSPVLKRIKQISAEFDPDIIQPETEADLKLVTDNIKEQLQQACQTFLDILDSQPFSKENSHTTGDGLKGATTGEHKTLLFQARTAQNSEYKHTLNLKAKLEHSNSKHTVQCQVIKQQNGQYIIDYQPLKRGDHELHLTVDGSPVLGSPFPIVVTPSAQSLNKPVRVLRGLKYPRGAAINSKRQMIVVEGGACVSVLTPEGEKIRTFGMQGSGNGQLSNAWGVTVDRDDNIYVAENGNNRIQKFNSEGEFVARVGTYGNNQLQFSYLVGIFYNHRDNNLYVPDQCNHRIQVLTTDLRFVRSFGTRGSGKGYFENVIDIAFDDANNLYVTDHNNNCVQVLTTEGQFLRTFSQKVNGQTLQYPWAITIDSNNIVYVSEFGSHCVSVFTSQGAYITTFGGRGSVEGQFNGIHGLSVNHNDSVIVSDCYNDRLQIYLYN